MSFWRKRQIDELESKDIEIPEPEEVETKKDEFDSNESCYTIGINNSGNTQLFLKAGYTTTTLTMGSKEVTTLIKLLATTIDEKYKVTITKI
jgi:hypothetical protein